MMSPLFLAEFELNSEQKREKSRPTSKKVLQMVDLSHLRELQCWSCPTSMFHMIY